MKKYIIISGIDGSGKTTVINELTKALEAEGKTTEYIWMRFNHYSVKAMNMLARMMGLSVKVHNAFGDVWEHRLYKNRTFCKLYVWCSYIDNKLARSKALKLDADYIICDRWMNDTLIDLGAECRISNILDGKWYYRFQNILPENSIQFVVIRNKKNILDCRIENITNPDFPYRYALYEKLLEKPEINTVNNSGNINESVQQIINIIKK
ncbi:thymidylate kinase [Bacteroides sp.]|uniref:thymidylate kinase n=1 Tax=Bacteroides sp. TaxID=29523 RepID=UPI002611731C|nr:thymidylate kinase [Bacteroides sp.]